MIANIVRLNVAVLKNQRGSRNIPVVECLLVKLQAFNPEFD